ncbi:prolyl aminopeptidase-like protein [Xylariaceae sp. FL1272]|nr:prolyl aminopeptidase-like protein [Xylariaceae sp. FL1272]
MLKLGTIILYACHNPYSRPGDVTIIGAHGNGFSEGSLRALGVRSACQSITHGFRIRGIWIADVAYHGHSYALDEQLLGNDPGWADHARDLLHMTNVFRADTPRPILAMMHPRLFSVRVLYDPVINVFSYAQTGAIFGARLSPRLPSHAIRDTPGDPTGRKVRLATPRPRHQETFTYFRPLYPYERPDRTIDREGAPDFDPAFNDPSEVRQHFPFYRSEGHLVVERLPNVRPSVLWVFGGSSDITLPPPSRSEIVRACGCNGSGDMAPGDGFQEMFHFHKTEREYAEWTRLSLPEKTTLSPEHAAALGDLPSRKSRADKADSKL